MALLRETKQWYTDDAAWLRARRRAGAMLTAFFAAAAIIYFVQPGSGMIYIPCWFYSITGLHCPGCGGIRGTRLILQGDILAGLSSNLLLAFALPLIAYKMAAWALFAFKGLQLPDFPNNKALIWVAIIITLLFTVLRNLPYAPLSFLAP